MKKYILMSAGAMAWRIDGIYDTEQQILEQLGIIDIDALYEYLDDNEMKIEEGYYYPQNTDNG